MLASLLLLSITAQAQDTLVSKKEHSAKRAAIMSAILPGSGQVYNGKWWKVPIIYAGFGGLGYMAYSNYSDYDLFLSAYKYKTGNLEEGVTISNRITVTGTANLILRDGATLTASKGITVNSGNTINIYAQIGGTGELNAGSDTSVASIGGGYRGASSGTVNIHGGKITATGGTNASGIGGALEGGNGEVNIYSGEVTAQGKNYAAGIGGYSGKSGGTVNIYGGTVNASGSQYGTTGIGIGGIKPGSCVVHIYGGEVTATSEKAAAGIQGTVTIDGGTVTANGGVSDGIDDSSGETYSSNGINGTIPLTAERSRHPEEMLQQIVIWEL